MQTVPPPILTRLAHTGPPPVPGTLWSTWTVDPVVLAGLLLLTFMYAQGLHTVRLRGRERLPLWQARSFAAGLLVLALALLSPLDGLSSALFSAHMVQHLLLVLVAAPLLVLGDPLLPLLWSLPLAWRRRAGHLSRQQVIRGSWRLLSSPAPAWLLAASALWLWHLPVLYQAALRSEPLHALEHGCLLGTSLLFWQVILQRRGGRSPGFAPAIAFVLAMGLQSSVLGIVIAFARPWYSDYAATTTAWHLTPAEDQQLAGLIMWIRPGAIYLAAVLCLIVRWLQAAEQEEIRRDRPIERAGASPGPLGTTGYAAAGEEP